jgi:internalin A
MNRSCWLAVLILIGAETASNAQGNPEQKALDAIGKIGGVRRIWRDDNLPGQPIVGMTLASSKDELLRHLPAFAHLQTLIFDCDITDATLKRVAELKQLRTLHVDNREEAEVTDVGIQELAKLKELQGLYIPNTKVTDEGLRHLSNLKKLQKLDLRETKVTDVGLKYLERLPKLDFIDLKRTAVTEAGVNQLRKMLPGCRIVAGK